VLPPEHARGVREVAPLAVGVIGVLIAAYIVKSLPLIALRWLVIVVIAYAAYAMLRSATQSSAPAPSLRSLKS
jgi:uncharacterized membrane protein YfcA